MLDKIDVANFFLNLDKERKYFNQTVVEKNGRNFYEGNARLNKLMHLAQNIFLAKTNKVLIDAEFFAYDNGAVIPEVQENFGRLSAEGKINNDFPNEETIFLKKIFIIFKDAPLDELIEIDHEDPEWQKKHTGYTKSEQKMDLISNIEDYKTRYKDILILMDKLSEDINEN